NGRLCSGHSHLGNGVISCQLLREREKGRPLRGLALLRWPGNSGLRREGGLAIRHAIEGRTGARLWWTGPSQVIPALRRWTDSYQDGPANARHLKSEVALSDSDIPSQLPTDARTRNSAGLPERGNLPPVGVRHPEMDIIHVGRNVWVDRAQYESAQRRGRGLN